MYTYRKSGEGRLGPIVSKSALHQSLTKEVDFQSPFAFWENAEYDSLVLQS